MRRRIIHFSDIHFGEGPLASGFHLDKRWLSTINHCLRRRPHWDGGALEWLAARIHDSRPDLVVFTGDLTASGGWHELSMAMKAMEPVLAIAPAFAFVPGNHDCYTANRRDRQSMDAACRDMNGGLGLNDFPALVTRGGVELLLTQMARPSTWLRPMSFCRSNGAMAPAAWQRLRELLATKRPADTCARLLAGHFPLRGPTGEDLGWHHRLDGWQELESALPGHVDGLLCGHIHRGFLQTLPNGIPQACAGSLTLNGDFCELDIDDDGDSLLHSTLQNRRNNT